MAKDRNLLLDRAFHKAEKKENRTIFNTRPYPDRTIQKKQSLKQYCLNISSIPLFSIFIYLEKCAYAELNKCITVAHTCTHKYYRIFAFARSNLNYPSFHLNGQVNCEDTYYTRVTKKSLATGCWIEEGKIK